MNKVTPISLSVFLRYFSLCFIVISAVACSNKDTIKPSSDTFNTIKAVSENEKRNTLLLEQAIKASPQDDYVLGPEDVIDIDVYEVEDLKRTVRVSPAGFIKLPLVNNIKAAGLTVAELETEIGKKLQQYLQEPAVTIFIKEYRSQRITVLGAVKNPQVQIVTRQKFLLDLLSLSGGLAEDAGDICYVQRGGGTVIINLNELLMKGNTTLNIPVFSEDVIHVPKGGVVFVDGAVKNPGSFVMKGTVTLSQVIAMAKGFNDDAIKDQLKVYRNSGTDAMEIIDVDYAKILAENGSDFVLKDKDVVIIPKSSAKAFWYGFVNTLRGAISFGGVSFGAGL
ncbi:MAG: polysaccharide biosynthesis/export family protein [Nitrospirae bacterium]|nr:polysaccharide biosynthesis/export family protein [Nitrospirota bacterium]